MVEFVAAGITDMRISTPFSAGEMSSRLTSSAIRTPMPTSRTAVYGRTRHSEKMSRRGTLARTEPIINMAQGLVACPMKAVPSRMTPGTGTFNRYSATARTLARNAGLMIRFREACPASRKMPREKQMRLYGILTREA